MLIEREGMVEHYCTLGALAGAANHKEEEWDREEVKESFVRNFLPADDRTHRRTSIFLLQSSFESTMEDPAKNFGLVKYGIRMVRL